MRRFSGLENVQGVSIPPVKPPDAPQGRKVNCRVSGKRGPSGGLSRGIAKPGEARLCDAIHRIADLMRADGAEKVMIN